MFLNLSRIGFTGVSETCSLQSAPDPPGQPSTPNCQVAINELFGKLLLPKPQK